MQNNKQEQETVEEEGLTLVGHLSELRRRLMIGIGSLIVASLIGYNFADRIAKDLISRAPDMNFIYISPSELMLSYIRIAIFVGLVISGPILISQIWLFIKPGLEKSGQRYIKLSLFLGGGFFILGALFAYIVVLPLIFKFFAGFQVAEIKANISFANYLNFVIRIVLAFGLVFELPILMFVLSRFGIVGVDFYKRNRKYMVLIIFVVAAILTPPDVVSQVLLAIPMLALYELGIILSGFGTKLRNK